MSSEKVIDEMNICVLSKECEKPEGAEFSSYTVEFVRPLDFNINYSYKLGVNSFHIFNRFLNVTTGNRIRFKIRGSKDRRTVTIPPGRFESLRTLCEHIAGRLPVNFVTFDWGATDGHVRMQLRAQTNLEFMTTQLPRLLGFEDHKVYAYNAVPHRAKLMHDLLYANHVLFLFCSEIARSFVGSDLLPLLFTTGASTEDEWIYDRPVNVSYLGLEAVSPKFLHLEIRNELNELLEFTSEVENQLVITLVLRRQPMCFL